MGIEPGSNQQNQNNSAQHSIPSHHVKPSFVSAELPIAYIYENNIPTYVNATMERLYANVYCSVKRIAVYDSLEGASTYVSKEYGIAKTIILFRKVRTRILVINQQVRHSDKEIEQFVKTIFDYYSDVQCVKFYALRGRIDSLPYAHDRVGELEENIILLPKTKESYLETLRPVFAKAVQAAEKRIKTVYPDFRIRFVARKEITINEINHVRQLAVRRMDAKGKTDYTENIRAEALLATAKLYGHMALATIDGETCAAALWLSLGQNHFHQIAAHAPEFDKYQLGNQIWLAAISRCIELGGGECWLMGGSNEHKAKFGAVTEKFYSINIYRSQLTRVLGFPEMLQFWTKQRYKTAKRSTVRILRPTRA
jgi:hypothetical protein